MTTAAVFLWRLGVPGLMDPDEGRYAEIAREMLLLGDWMVPRLNLVPYLEKPPLVYWLTALSLAGLGPKEFAARLPSALAALGGAGLAYGLGRVLWGEREGFWSAMVLATAGGYVVLGRLLTLDMVFSLFLNLAIALGFLSLHLRRSRLWPGACVALALAVLAKGPAAVVLAGLTWLGAAFLLGREAFKALWRPLWLLALLVLTLPWFLAVAWQIPEFPRYFLVEHHLERYLDGRRFHAAPVWYYGPVLALFLLPWTALVPWAVSRRTPLEPSLRLFLLWWAAVTLGFFSLSRGKLAPYVLPALLPLSLLTGEALASIQARTFAFRGNFFFLASLILGASGGWLLLWLSLFPPKVLEPLLAQAGALRPYLVASFLVLALTPTLTLLVRRPEILLAGALGFALLIPRGMEQVAEIRSFKPLGLSLKHSWQPGAALVGVYVYSPGLSFYSGKPFHLLKFRTELDFGFQVAGASPLLLESPEELVRFLNSRPLVFLLVKTPDLPWLLTLMPRTPEPVAQKGDYLLLKFSPG